MTTSRRAKAELYKRQIQRKIDDMLAEFADGKLNRDQFHAIYSHYSKQLALVERAIRSGALDDLHANAGETIAIRQTYMGKALGLVIYHHRSGLLIETLGDFEVPPTVVAPVLNDFSALRQASQYVERRVVRVTEGRWLLFAAGRFTTVVTLFQNEPSPEQSREIERLHHDFEIANEAFLSGASVEVSRLAYPFVVFVQQKLKRW